MRRHRIPLILSVLILTGGCTEEPAAERPRDDAGPTTVAPAPDGTSSGTATDTEDPDTGPTTTRPGAGPAAPQSRIAYPWGVPTAPARVSHPNRVPVAPPPEPPLPYLVGIEAGDHPEDGPGYSRITFTFRGGFPTYHLEYVAAVRAEGTNEAIPLPGNAFLRIRFVQAQAHDERGISTVTASPRPELGYRTLLGYGFAGDFEGYLTYGLGLRVPADSDGALPVRAVEVTRPDGTFTVAVDVRRG